MKPSFSHLDETGKEDVPCCASAISRPWKHSREGGGDEGTWPLVLNGEFASRRLVAVAVAVARGAVSMMLLLCLVLVGSSRQVWFAL